MSTVTEKMVRQALAAKFPGREYYWCGKPYNSEHPERTLSGSTNFDRLHKEHWGLVYCGCLDSFSQPRSAYIFRSTTLRRLLNLIGAEDPEYRPDYSKHKKRFQ